MNTEPLVMAVDDEPGILRLIKRELSTQGFRVVTASDGEAALAAAAEHRPDIALLDIVMPEMTGLELMRRLRENASLPIILLTAKGNEADKVRGLELGADDYIAKPFSPAELSARVRAVLRRSTAAASTAGVVAAGDVEINLNTRLVTRGGEVVALTRNEWMLLQTLAANAGRIMLNAELLIKVWGTEYFDDLQYLRVWVSRLRKKLEADPSNPTLIKTFQGIGYMLSTSDGSADGKTNGALEGS